MKFVTSFYVAGLVMTILYNLFDLPHYKNISFDGFLSYKIV